MCERNEIELFIIELKQEKEATHFSNLDKGNFLFLRLEDECLTYVLIK